MPNLNLGFCALFCTAPVIAATCAKGYYLDNGTCQQCNPNNEPYYCPGDDIRHLCPRTDTNYEKYGYTFIKGAEVSWASSPTARNSNACICDIYFRDAYGNEFLLENAFNGTDYWGDRRLWYKAAPGYYLSSYNWSSGHDWYNALKECTNAPAHAHYPGPGTPDEPRAGGATDANDCPWACDDGYGRVGDACQPLCATGITHLHAGTVSVPLFRDKNTSPALVVRTAGGVCYGNLTPGTGTGINITVAGTNYHL